MKLKNTILTLLVIFASNVALSNGVDSIVVDSKAKTINVGGLLINNNVTMDQVIAKLGKPDVIDSNAYTEMPKRLLYNGLGLAFELNKEKKVEAVSITYNWDNDKKTASGKYKGVLLMDNYMITESVSVSDINANTLIKDINCMMPALCMNNPKSGFLVMTGYNKDHKIIQIGFGFTSK